MTSITSNTLQLPDTIPSHSDELTHITIQLNHKIDPMLRGDIYEDPLQDYFDEVGWGEVSGGGTLLSDEFGIDYCDVEIDVPQLTTTLPLIIHFIEAQGAPKGSKLIIYPEDSSLDNYEIPLGKNEGIALCLKTANLPEYNKEHNPIQEWVNQAQELLGEKAIMDNSHFTDEELKLYFYGNSNQVIQNQLAPLVASTSWCQGHRWVILTP